MSGLKAQYALVRDFFRAGFTRLVIGCAAGLAVSAGIGYAAALAAPEMVETVLDAFQKLIADAGVIDDAGHLSVFPLLLNNWRAMIVSMLYGFAPFLFLPALSLVTNGALLGLMAGYYQTQGLSLGLYAAGILPHGIFELSALVLAIACGVCLCRNMCQMVVRSPKRVPLVELLSDLLRVLLLVIMPLTVAAAFVECYVTPLVMGQFLP